MHPARLLATALCFLLFSSVASAHSDAAPTQLFDEVTERARELAAPLVKLTSSLTQCRYPHREVTPQCIKAKS